jgi:hypothetical protein
MFCWSIFILNLCSIGRFQSQINRTSLKIQPEPDLEYTYGFRFTKLALSALITALFLNFADLIKHLHSVLRIQTLLIRIQILHCHFDTDSDPAFQFDTDPDLLFNLIRIRMIDQDSDPYCFKEVLYLKQYFLYISILFSLSVGPTGHKPKGILC